MLIGVFQHVLSVLVGAPPYLKATVRTQHAVIPHALLLMSHRPSTLPESLGTVLHLNVSEHCWGGGMLQRLTSGMIEWQNVLCVSLDVFYPGKWFIAGVTQVLLNCKFGCKWSERREEMSWLIVTHLSGVVFLLRKWCSTFFCHTRGNVMTAACIRPRITQGITLLERVLLLQNWQIRLLAVLIGLSEGGCRWTSPPLSCLLIYYLGFLSDCVKKKIKNKK